MTDIAARPAMDPEPECDQSWLRGAATWVPDMADEAREAAEIRAEVEAERDAPEWDDAESSAYVARVEGEMEPEAGL